MSSPKIAVVTGTNSGIGFETIGQLIAAKEPYIIYCGARSIEKAKDAVKRTEDGDSRGQKDGRRLIPIVIDIDSDKSILDAVKEIEKEHDHVDLLINNAGINGEVGPKEFSTSRETINATLNTNIGGSYQLTYALAPLIIKSKDPRIIFVSSDVGSFARDGDPNYPLNKPVPAGWPKNLDAEYPSYRASKAALNMIMRHWARWLEGDGVKVWAICPGLAATNLAGVGVETLRSWGAIEPVESAKFILTVVEGQRDADAGKFIESKGVIGF